MNGKFLYGILLMGFLTIPTISYGQNEGLQEILTGEKDTSEEDKNLEFQSYFFEALKQKAINNYSKAIENLENCYVLDSTSIAVEFEFSKNYLLLKKYFEAEIFIDKALAKDPKNVHLLKHKVSILKANRNFDEAIEIQKELINISVKNSDELVLLYLQNRNYNKAKKLISEIEENGLSSSRIRGFKQYIYNRENATKNTSEKPDSVVEVSDLDALRKEFEVNNNYKVLQQLLNLELEKELFNLLYLDSKNGLELFPAQPSLYQINGLALNKLTKYNEAIAVLTVGIDFVIDNNEMEANFYEQLSIAFYGLKNDHEGLKYQQKYEKLRHGK